MDRLISEFEVIRAIEKYVDNIFTKNMGDLINDIKAIPSAEPQTEDNCDTCSKKHCGDALCFGNNYCNWQPKQAIPSAEPQIIRCKDCKHYKRIELNSCDEVIATCKKHTDRNYHYISPFFYCADGERVVPQESED